MCDIERAPRGGSFESAGARPRGSVQPNLAADRAPRSRCAGGRRRGTTRTRACAQAAAEADPIVAAHRDSDLIESGFDLRNRFSFAAAIVNQRIEGIVVFEM